MRYLFCVIILVIVAGCVNHTNNSPTPVKLKRFSTDPPAPLKNFCVALEKASFRVRNERFLYENYSEKNNKRLYDEYLQAVLPYTPSHIVHHIEELARGEVEASFDEFQQTLWLKRQKHPLRFKSQYYRGCYGMFGPMFYQDPKSPLYKNGNVY